MEAKQYDRRCARIKRLIQRLRYQRAETMAEQLATTELGRLEAVVLWNLAACCNGGALDRSGNIIELARKRGASPIIIGDMLRDRGKTAITHGWLEAADRYLTEAGRLHEDDLNRLACLQGLRGRWHDARGELKEAVQAHITADQAWCALGDQVDRGWALNNQVALTMALAKLSEQTARRVIAADSANRGARHIVLCGITILLPIGGWRLANRLVRMSR